MSALTPLLVVVVPRAVDWRRVVVERWYRIPLRALPSPVAAEYLAFFRTRSAGADTWEIASYAPVLRYDLRRRREILPGEPAHPRADDWYYRVALGSLQWLPAPLPSRRLRRVTFIPTALETLLTADDVADLWRSDERRAVVWGRFPDAARKATRRLELDDRAAPD